MLGRWGASLRSRLDAVRGSYWFVPTLLVLFATVLAAGMTEVDRRLTNDVDQVAPWLFARNSDVVRAVLTTIAGSMMTVTGVVFSITIVALTLASSQFGPRLLRTFMYDRGNQLVLGTFLATFVYCLLTLRVVGNADATDAFVPYLAASIAVALALVSLCVLIYFIHHIASSLQVTTIAAEVSAELEDSVDSLFPERLGREPTSEEERARTPPDTEPHAVVRATTSGHVRILDQDRLLALATGNDLLVQVRRQPGDFVPCAGVLADLYASDPAVLRGEGEDEPALVGDVRACFALGAQRTTAQDLRFLLNQLNDVALRALSPGINDPRTARICVRYLGAALARLAGRRFPSPNRLDEEGRLRVIAPAPGFEDLVRESFDSIRVAGRGFPEVAIELLDALAEMLAQTEGAARRAVLAEIVDEVCEDAVVHLDHAPDRERVKGRAAQVLPPDDSGDRDASPAQAG